MKVYAPSVATVSGLNATGWDDDLRVPAARQITVDHMSETTAGHDIQITAGTDLDVADNVTLASLPLGSGTITKTYAVTTTTETSAAHSTILLDSVGAGAGEQVTLVTPTRIASAIFWLANANGTPTGLLYCRILNSAGTIIDQATTTHSANIPGDYVERTFLFGTPQYLLPGVYYIMVIAAEGSGGNNVAVSVGEGAETRSTARKLVAPATFSVPDATHYARGTTTFGGTLVISG